MHKGLQVEGMVQSEHKNRRERSEEQQPMMSGMWVSCQEVSGSKAPVKAVGSLQAGLKRLHYIRFIHSSIHVFDIRLLRFRCMQDTILGAGDTIVDKTEIPALMAFTVNWRRQTISRINKYVVYQMISAVEGNKEEDQEGQSESGGLLFEIRQVGEASLIS